MNGMCPAGTGAFHSFSFGRLRGGRRCVGLRTGALKITKQGLSFERWFLCPAGTGAFLYLLFGPPARRAGVRASSCILACRLIERHGPCGHGGLTFTVVWTACAGKLARGSTQGGLQAGLSFERCLLCPADTGAFLFCCLGRLRRGQGGAGYGAAPPSRPPLHPPRSTPLGVFQLPTFREGCAASASGASSLRSVISLRAAQCQRALSPCVRGRKQFAYPPHAQREVTP